MSDLRTALHSEKPLISHNKPLQVPMRKYPGSQPETNLVLAEVT